MKLKDSSLIYAKRPNVLMGRTSKTILAAENGLNSIELTIIVSAAQNAQCTSSEHILSLLHTL